MCFGRPGLRCVERLTYFPRTLARGAAVGSARRRRFWFTSALLVVAGLSVAAGSATAQVAAVPVMGWTADVGTVGTGVTALAAGQGNVLYMSGDYDRLAMRTGH